MFATNSEVADAISVFVAAPGADGTDWLAMAHVLRGSAGMEVRRTWDKWLGIRGSGSHDIAFTGCFVPDAMITLLTPLGPPPAEAAAGIVGSVVGLVGTYLGVAEAQRARIRGHDLADHSTSTRIPVRWPSAPASSTSSARSSALLLATVRAVLAYVGRTTDEYLARQPLGDHDSQVLMQQFACAKLTVERAAIDLVDHAMTAVGGGSYLPQPALPFVPRRSGRAVHATVLPRQVVPLHRARSRALGLDANAELRAAVAQLTDHRADVVQERTLT